jgi:hypothetical protein
MRVQAIGDSSLELRVEDNGVGFEPRAVPRGHYGLVGLREQAAIIDAALHIHSVPNQGTTVRVVLRLSPLAFKPIDDPMPLWLRLCRRVAGSSWQHYGLSAQGPTICMTGGSTVLLEGRFVCFVSEKC